MLPRITTELGTVSQLDDRPNDTGGLTAAELKAKFDKDSGVIKNFLNNTLIPYLESTSGAGSVGIKTITGLSASEVQSALEQIMEAMQGITQGAVPDASITLAKLAGDVTAANLGGASSTHTHKAADITEGSFSINQIPNITTAKLADAVITTAKLAAAVVTAEKIAANAVQSAHISQGAVTNIKIAEGAVNSSKIAAGGVATSNLADGSVTETKLKNITYSSIGLNGNQVRTITVGTDAPSGGSDGDIYIQYEG